MLIRVPVKKKLNGFFLLRGTPILVRKMATKNFVEGGRGVPL